MPKKRRKRQTRLPYRRDILPATPTNALPGTEEKILALMGRVARGEELHPTGDVMFDPLRHLATLQKRNGYFVVTGEAETRQDPGENVEKVGQPRDAGRNTDRRKTRSHSMVDVFGSFPDPLIIGERLREAREAKKMTLRGVELASGIPRNTIGRAEEGLVAGMHYEVFVRLAEAYRVSLDRLLGRVLKKRKAPCRK